jgi:hypothetical protein
MLRCLLLEELAVPAFGDDLHRIILGYKPVEIVHEGLAYDRALLELIKRRFHVPTY